MDAATGKPGWRSEPGQRLVVSRGHVAVIGQSGGFAILERATGRKLWSQYSREFLDLDDESCVWQMGEATIRSDAATGDDRWRTRTRASGRRVFRFGSTLVVAGSQVAAVDAATGTVLWRFDAGTVGHDGAVATQDSVIVFDAICLRAVAVRAVRR